MLNWGVPAKNTIKLYLENGYYHLYNRGVEKREIFLDGQDYNVFLRYLSEYLLPKDTDALQQQLAIPQLPWAEKSQILKLLRLNNFSENVALIAYCLMPNHFHFFLKQNDENSIDSFMQSVCTRYTMYFNKKWNRVGSLFQAVYKGVLVTSDEQFLHLTRYIHKQAFLQGLVAGVGPQPSSYPEYLGLRKTAWIYPEEVLSYFSETNREQSYKDFVESGLDDESPIRKILIEE